MKLQTYRSNHTIQRRDFLKTLGVTAAATALGPFGIRTGAKTDSRNPVVGEGDHLYEVIHDWAQLPPGHVWGNTHSVVEDSQGRIHIKHTVGKGADCKDAVLVFDAAGKFIRSWGSEYKGGAHGMRLNREGNSEFLYLADTARRIVVKTTLDGEEIWRVGTDIFGDLYSDTKRFCPTNVATAPDGTVFVADGYGASFIHRFDHTGDYYGSFGGVGSEAGQLNCPHGLMVDTRGKNPGLVVADRGNRRLQYFTLEGIHLRFVKDELRAPCHFDERNGVLLIPDLESRVTLFDRDNKLIAHLGDGTHYKGIRDKSRECFTPGKFVAPHGACFDHEGNIFVVEWVEVGRVTKLRRIS